MGDNIIAMLIIAGVIALFIILGMFLLNGKGSSLIAGYNTMSPEEKEKYDIARLTKFMGKMMFALSFSMFFWILSIAFEMNGLFYTGLILFLGIVVYMIIYINTGDRFKKREYLFQLYCKVLC